MIPFFLEASNELWLYLKWVLLCFVSCFGFRNQFGKEWAYFDVSSGWCRAVGCEVWCRVGHLLTKYMGFAFGVSFKCSVVWNFVKGRFEKRLASWKRLYFSKGNAFVLLKVYFPISQFTLMSLLELLWVGWFLLAFSFCPGALHTCIVGLRPILLGTF